MSCFEEENYYGCCKEGSQGGLKSLWAPSFTHWLCCRNWGPKRRRGLLRAHLTRHEELRLVWGPDSKSFFIHWLTHHFISIYCCLPRYQLWVQHWRDWEAPSLSLEGYTVAMDRDVWTKHLHPVWARYTGLKRGWQGGSEEALTSSVWISGEVSQKWTYSRWGLKNERCWMGWDGNLGRERLKLKSHRRLGKNGTFRKETCL